MKRFIVFAYDPHERGAGWQNIFGMTYELREAEMLVAAAKDAPGSDVVELYDIKNESLIVEWVKGIDGLWREFEPD
jgi:hypothetical protein